MIALKFPNQKQFTQALFLQPMFDAYTLYEGSVVTGCTYEIDGHRNAEYYMSDEEEAPQGTYLRWEEIRPSCFQMIKGKRLPLQFKFVLRAPETLVEQLLASTETGITADQVQALHLIVQYRSGELTVTTGTALSFFTLDKTLEQLWDRYVGQFFEKQQFETV